MEKEGHFSASTAREATIRAIGDAHEDVIDFIFEDINIAIVEKDFDVIHIFNNSEERGYVQKYFEHFGYKTSTYNAEHVEDEGFVTDYILRITW